MKHKNETTRNYCARCGVKIIFFCYLLIRAPTARQVVLRFSWYMSPTLVNARFSVLLLVLAAAATALMPHGLNDDPNFFPITVWLNSKT